MTEESMQNNTTVSQFEGGCGERVSNNSEEENIEDEHFETYHKKTIRNQSIKHKIMH